MDFDRRNKRDDDGIATLTQAAAKSRIELAAQVRFEAARIATDSGQIDQARALLAELLKADPRRADYLARMAETYAAANDDAGFIRFANAEIDAMKKAPLAADDRNARIAALFASAHGSSGQLIAFCRKTMAEAPRDWRWPIVLARIETALEIIRRR